jgi:DNA polymerase-3 subunit chi
MTEILFYHLERQPLERVLPSLVERALSRDWRVLIRAESDERVEALSNLLWTYSEESFLPHGTKLDGNPSEHPVWITSDNDSPNSAQVLMAIGGVPVENASAFTRVVIMFSGDDEEAVAAARDRWKRAKAEGHDVSYWQQDDTGRWINRAAGSSSA